MTITPRTRGQAGVTLVELLIAVALMGIILLGIAPLFIASVKSNYSAQEFTSIHNLARDRLEQLMNLPITDAQLVASPCSAPVSYPNDLPATLPDPTTGIPPSNVKNTLTRTYTVQLFRFPVVDISLPGAVPNGNPFVSTCVDPPNQYHYKRIDVTVTSSTMGTNLGIGYRAARVTGYLRNTDPINNLN
jgi:prepilin-type N-terminal cleavage/methylation domain-containing protein